ncbi:MAG: MoaD/ThiS family protein [Methanobacteriaceae archaeon]|nr:MoaD/ThiS family protein [Methanobacteriaceae archaeon]
MNITLKQDNNKKEINIEKSITIKELLKKEEIPLETVVVKKNNITVTEDELINDKDTIEVIRVIFGG